MAIFTTNDQCIMKELGISELPALGKVRQEDGEFGVNLSYMVKPSLL